LDFSSIFSTTISKNPVLSLFTQALGGNDAVIGLMAAFSAPLTIGSYQSSGFVDTQIGDVIVSNVARSDAELQSRGVLTPLPIDNATVYKLAAMVA